MSNFRLLRPQSPYPLLTDDISNYLQQRSIVEHEAYRQLAEAANRALRLPSFRVHRNDVNQTGVVTSVQTPIQFNSIATAGDHEGYDDFGYFDTTSFIYLPLVAGVYSFYLSVQFVATAVDTSVAGRVYKNGAVIVGSAKAITSTTTSPQVCVAAQCRMNGKTDYVQFYAFQDSGGNQDVNGLARLTFAGGCKLADY